jgi:glycine/serine hydroxymethyltransferase
MTTRGLMLEDFVEIGHIMADAIWGHDVSKVQTECKKRVKELVSKFPLYKNRRDL